MKKIFIVILMCLPMIVMAQNSWEKPVEKNNTDSKYLAGAVPVVDGKVVFETNISAPGKKAGEIYQTMLRELEAMTKKRDSSSRAALSRPIRKKTRFVPSIRSGLCSRARH